MLNCGKTTTCSDAEMDAWTLERPYEPNNPRWQLYAYSPLSRHHRDRHGHVADVRRGVDCRRPGGIDDDPTTDATSGAGAGILLMRAKAFGPNGVGSRDRSHSRRAPIHGARTRIHGPARSGRTEPPRAQSRRADPWQGAHAFAGRHHGRRVCHPVRHCHHDVIPSTRARRAARRPVGGRRAGVRAARSAAVPEDLADGIEHAAAQRHSRRRHVAAHAARRRRHLLRSGTYARTLAAYEAALGLDATNTSTRYRRKYLRTPLSEPAATSTARPRSKPSATSETGYATFYERTRLAIARRGLIRPSPTTSPSARFALVKTRQTA